MDKIHVSKYHDFAITAMVSVGSEKIALTVKNPGSLKMPIFGIVVDY